MIDESQLNLASIKAANASYAVERPLEGKPAKRLCVLTCMDARLDLFPALGLAVGDAHYLRNAGGRVTPDVLRSLALSAHHLGTREFAVIHHTRCGLYQGANDAIRSVIAANALGDPSGIDFLPFDDLAGSVQEDVDAVIASRLLPGDAVVWGATIDVDTGSLHVVVAPTPVA